MPAHLPRDDTWPALRAQRGSKQRLLGAVAACVAALAGQAAFLRWNETRSGVVLDDPILARFTAIDLSVPTFVLIYGALAVGLVVLARRPRHLSVALWAYAFTATARVLLMWLVPLDPPPDIIPLVDPLVAAAADGPLVRDLFFSGHTATLCLLALAVPVDRLRPWLWAAMAAVAAGTVLQHSHYVVDVLVAPPVTYLCMRLARRVERGRGPAA